MCGQGVATLHYCLEIVILAKYNVLEKVLAWIFYSMRAYNPHKKLIDYFKFMSGKFSK